MTCSVWPETKMFGCMDSVGDIWQLLTTNMDTSSTSSCEFLCRLRGDGGCCYLHDGANGKHRGCWWKGGSQAFKGEDSSATGIAITCTKIGKMIKSI